MKTIKFNGKSYRTDTHDFLVDPMEWGEDFALGMAPKVGIITGLTKDHWKVIHFIRDSYKKCGKCPLVYETCCVNRLHTQELKRLFPSGYLRGACKLAGITFKEGYLDQSGLEDFGEWMASTEKEEKSYQINVRGFLINPSNWDEQYARYKAYEMKNPKLTPKHWQIIHFLRNSFAKNNMVPTLYETCEANGIEIEELQKLFPDGYHRGAVKVSGLRVR